MAAERAPSTTAVPTLAELTAALELAAPPEYVAPPAAEATLRAYVLAVGGGRGADELMVALGYDPALADRVAGGLQTMPEDAVRRIAEALSRPVAEVVWACGGRVLRAPAPGVGRRVP